MRVTRRRFSFIPRTTAIPIWRATKLESGTVAKLFYPLKRGRLGLRLGGKGTCMYQSNPIHGWSWLPLIHRTVERERERELIEVVCEEYKRKLDDSGYGQIFKKNFNIHFRIDLSRYKSYGRYNYIKIRDL